jgi:thiamine biosynthesis protein ThiI
VESKAILLRYGEIALKSGPTRRRFELALLSSVKSLLSLAQIPNRVIRRSGRIFVETAEPAKAVEILKRVFGIVSLSIVSSVQFSDLTDLSGKCAELVGERPASFAVRAKRAAEYPFNSMQAGREIGSAVCAKFPGAKVDLETPEFELFVEIREGNEAFVSTEIFQGPSGLPWGAEGRALFLFDGTEEAALSSWLMMKRGCSPVFLYTGPMDTEGLEKSAKVFSQIRPYIPKKKILLFVGGAPPEKLATSRECHAIVSPVRAKAGQITEKLSNPNSSEFPVFTPLLFASNEEISSLAKRVFLPEKLLSFGKGVDWREWAVLEEEVHA